MKLCLAVLVLLLGGINLLMRLRMLLHQVTLKAPTGRDSMSAYTARMASLIPIPVTMLTLSPKIHFRAFMLGMR